MKFLLLFLVLCPILAWGQMWNDDFEDGDIADWQTYGDGTWGLVSDGSLCLEQSNSSASDSWAMPDAVDNQADYIMTARVKVLGFSSDGAVEILCRMDNGDIHFGIGHMTGFDGIYIYDDINGVFADSMTMSISYGEWYHYQAKLQGDDVKFKVWREGDAEPVDYQLSAVVTGWNAGKIGVRTSNASARWDDLILLEADMPVPSVGPIGLLILMLILLLAGGYALRRVYLHA